MVAVFLGYVPFLYCKRAASARASLRSRKGRTNFFVSRSATANDSHAVAALHVHDAFVIQFADLLTESANWYHSVHSASNGH